MSVRRVRENLTHGARWRREETSASRLRRAAWAPPADPTGRPTRIGPRGAAESRATETSRTFPPSPFRSNLSPSWHHRAKSSMVPPEVFERSSNLGGRERGAALHTKRRPSCLVELFCSSSQAGVWRAPPKTPARGCEAVADEVAGPRRADCHCRIRVGLEFSASAWRWASTTSRARFATRRVAA